MSRYFLITTNTKIPEVDNTNTKIITVKEAILLGIESPHIPFEELDPNEKVLIVDPENENELVISKDTYYDVSNLSSYEYKYEVKFGYQEDKLPQLLDYLKNNIQLEQELELWNIWVSEVDESIPYSRCSIEELSLELLTEWFNQYGCCCLVIYR